jgi:hypothetical protein
MSSAIIGAALAKKESDDLDDIIDTPSGRAGSNTRSYGALSNFIDPLSTAGGVGRSPAPSQISQGSSPTTSPLRVPSRTPSPFGSHKLAPNTVSSMSAAAMTPNETPDTVRERYNDLVNKYGLDT